MIAQSCVTLIMSSVGLNWLFNRYDAPFFDFYRDHALQYFQVTIGFIFIFIVFQFLNSYFRIELIYILNEKLEMQENIS